MKWQYFLLFFLSSSSLVAQESKFTLLSEININDSLTLQTGELMIFNNTAGPICLRVSSSFRARILSRDTIQINSGDQGNGCYRYDLWVSKEDTERGFNDNPRYPLVLNSRTCFVATISLIRNLKCKDSWIEFSYINQPDIDYCELEKKYERHQVWDSDQKLKYKNGRVYFDSKVNYKGRYD